MTTSTTSPIPDLVKAKLVGRKIDVVGFVDDLLEFVKEFGEIRCWSPAEDRLRFEMPDGESCDVELDAGQSKVRMLCVRLAALCKESGDVSVSPYGGESAIKRRAVSPLGNGTARSGNESAHWQVRFRNTPSDQEFTLAVVKIPAASSAIR